jgi:hypothetical protein
VCRWRADEPPVEPDPDDPVPIKHPLVYHLFGRYDQPASVVLTEDDYFNYLIAVARQRSLLPTTVRRALTDTSLLFTGFWPGDWGFRMLLRILAMVINAGGGRRSGFTDFAVLSPAETSDSPLTAKVRSQLQHALTKDIAIYWGDVEDFAADLMERSGAGTGGAQ